MKDIIVTGGRDFLDYETVKKTLSLFDIGLLIQGGATGADALAKRYAIEFNIPFEEVPAQWMKHGRAAGPIRNREMLEKYPNAVVIAFPGGDGTGDCKRQALHRHMLVLEVK